MKRVLTTLALALAACGTFEDPTIVLDLRVIGMTAEPPDQVVDVDLAEPSAAAILSQLGPTEVSAYVADPNRQRDLRWSMTLCLVDMEGRCDRSLPYKELGGGTLSDPDESQIAQRPTAVLFPDVTMLAMLQRALEDSPVQALGGVELTVMLRVGGVDESPDLDLYAAKIIRVSPRFPAGRTANTNPDVQYLDAAVLGITLPAPRVRCSDPGSRLQLNPVSPGDLVTLFPIEPDGTREKYVVPTLDGQTQELEEVVSYQWLAELGSWSDEFTGGGRDLLGNVSLLGSDWRAPEVNDDTLVSIWMIQRDERYGAMVYESCMLVSP